MNDSVQQMALPDILFLSLKVEGRMSTEARVIFICLAILLISPAWAQPASAAPPATQESLAEWTIESDKVYKDPFNDVDVDVVFSKDGQSWRVPTFWRGGSQWTVRFAPPTPGNYAYHVESTDKHNPDLNGRAGQIMITAYRGDNPLLQHGMLRVSGDKRHFEHADSTPFYWLGDTLWTGLSDRLPWDGFLTLTADRKKKGFTVVQICAGLPPTEELAPIDPGSGNEGGAVWDPQFKRINPKYFDYADRRIQHLIDSGIAPAIVGAWSNHLAQMGSAKIKRHWRYVIARYGAYPVFWVLAGAALDPPQSVVDRMPKAVAEGITRGWTDMARYVRAIDPYHHPLTVHEAVPPYDFPVQDESVTDFDLTEPGHMGWPSLGGEVVLLNTRYARTDLTKPLVIGEVGYELIYGSHLEDFQRVAFWLAMLNGAAGYTYGAAPTYEVNNPDKPLHRGSPFIRGQFTFLTWQEGMNLPGSYQVGLSAKLLQQYPWWQMAPHPEWVVPRGTTLLDPHAGRSEFDPDAMKGETNADFTPTDDYIEKPESVYPAGEWQARNGTFRKPYAAGIPGKFRVIYMPSFGELPRPRTTVLDLEKDVRYHAYYWEPMLGIKFDLGTIALPAPGALEFQDGFEGAKSSRWMEQGSAKTTRDEGQLRADGATVSVVKAVNLQNAVVAVDSRSDSSAGLLLRYQDDDNYLAAIYSEKEKILYWVTRTHGVDSTKLGMVAVPELGREIHLRAEARLNFIAASVTDGHKTYSTPIADLGVVGVASVDASKIPSGAVGLLHQDDGHTQHFDNFEVRQSPKIAEDEPLNRNLYDARGEYRGQLSGPGWDDFGRNKVILLSSYLPERVPSHQDWVLVLDAESAKPTR